MTDEREDRDTFNVERLYPEYEKNSFELGTARNDGRPHWYVTVDLTGANGQAIAWWLDPEQAIEVGRRLTELGEECQTLNRAESGD